MSFLGPRAGGRVTAWVRLRGTAPLVVLAALCLGQPDAHARASKHHPPKAALTKAALTKTALTKAKPASGQATSPPAAATGAARPPIAPKAREAARAVMGDRARVFCHDESYTLSEDAHRWCELAAAESVPCPAWKAICAKPPGKPSGFLHRNRPMPHPFEGLPDLTWPFRIVLGAIVLGLVVGLARLGRTPALPKRTAEGPLPEELAADARAHELHRQQVETDVQRLLARAADAAAAGDFLRACNDAYAALLRRLEGRGLWRVEPHLTNGDMVRAVTRPKPDLGPELRAVVRDVETVQFGREAPTRATFDAIAARVDRLLRHPLLLLCLALTALGGLASCEKLGGDADAWNASPNGHAALVPFLKAYGFDAHERIAPLRRLGTATTGGTVAPLAPEPDVLVLLPTANVEEADWKAIDGWLTRGARLIVIAGPAADRAPWKRLEGLSSTPEAAGVADVQVVVAGVVGRPDAPVLHLPHRRMLEGTPGDVALAYVKDRGVYGRRITIPLVAAASASPVAPPTGEAVAGTDDDEDDEDDHEDDDDEVGDAKATLAAPLQSEMLVLADAAAFANASLLFPENATALTALLGAPSQRVEVVSDVASLVADSPAETVERSGFAPAFLQLAVLLLFAFVARGASFGTLRDPPVESRRAFVEHVRAVGALYERAGHATRALQVFATYVVERLRQRHGQAGGRSLSSLAEAVAARTGQSLGQVMSLLVETKETSLRDKEALARMRELAALLHEKAEAKPEGRSDGKPEQKPAKGDAIERR